MGSGAEAAALQDTLKVTRLERLGRSVAHLVVLEDQLHLALFVSFEFRHQMPLSFGTAFGMTGAHGITRRMLQITGAFNVLAAPEAG